MQMMVDDLAIMEDDLEREEMKKSILKEHVR
jgi:hypothetical protein